MNYSMRETHLQANSSEWVFIRKPCTVSELPTELEALKESPELTVKLNCSLRKTLRATGSVKFNSASDQHNSLMEEFSTSIASFWITISLLLIFVLISLILSFFIFIIIYAIIIAFLVISHLMLYVDVYTEAVVLSILIRLLDKTNQLTGYVYVRIKVRDLAMPSMFSC